MEVLIGKSMKVIYRAQFHHVRSARLFLKKLSTGTNIILARGRPFHCNNIPTFTACSLYFNRVQYRADLLQEYPDRIFCLCSTFYWKEICLPWRACDSMWFKCLQHLHTLKGYKFCLEKVHASFQGKGTLHRFKAGSYYVCSNPFERVCYSFKNVRYTSWTIPFI